MLLRRAGINRKEMLLGLLNSCITYIAEIGYGFQDNHIKNFFVLGGDVQGKGTTASASRRTKDDGVDVALDTTGLAGLDASSLASFGSS